MASIQDLIDQLNQIDDKDQSIMFQYYLAEHFEFSDGTPSPTPEQFDQAVDDLDDESLWEDAHETINDYLYGICESDNEQEEND
jgi:hypothetical protein